MSITVCTGFSPKGYLEYGKKFLDTFDKFWPKEINLLVYIEEEVELPRGECKLLWDCEGSADFYWRNKDIPEHCGKAPTEAWKRKEFNEGYSWRQDAVKFFRQCMIPEHAAKDMNKGDILIWLDADVVTFKEPPVGFPKDLFETGYDLLHLGRAITHSEIGFWAVRIKPITRQFLAELAEIYRSDRIFTYRQTHSAFAFDKVRKVCETNGMHTRNIATPGANGHVWFESVLGTFCDHLKGARRKRMGFSIERPRVV